MREPLLHFLLLGLALFALYGVVNGGGAPSPNEIVLDTARLANLRANFEKTWQRPPTGSEMQSIIDGWVRDEVLYREGVAIGFDQNDPVIRRRVAQKMAFVADGMVPDTPPESELDAWLQANMETYRIAAVFTFEQVYIDPQRHANELQSHLEAVRASLDGGPDGSARGDATLLPPKVRSAHSGEVARTFGAAFADELATLPVGSWHGPVESGYGLHFVRLSERIPARDPALDEVRPAVVRDVLNQKAREINDAFYATLRQRYTVRTETDGVD